MKKNGFTLIELAAVIMILGIIMLIAVPIVLNTIENSKKGAAERSAESYLHTVETTVAWEKTVREIKDGEYTIQEDGSLCLDNDCTGENKIAITMSGNKPNSGTVVIENANVVSEGTTMTIGDYSVSYDSEEKKYVAEKQEVKKLCRPATAEEVTTGNVPQGNYAYGDEYICDVGDGVDRIFFILEDGDNPTLTKGDGTSHTETDQIGTTSDGEVALIINQNVGSTLPQWCSNQYNNTCNGNIVRSDLKTETSTWTAEEIISIDLPTYAQIYAVNNNTQFSSKSWLYDYLDNDSSTSTPVGYWTSTHHATYTTSAWTVRYNGRLFNASIAPGGNYGIRPVITIPKNQLG